MSGKLKPLILGDEVTAVRLRELKTWNVKPISTRRTINAVLLNIKTNVQKLVNINGSKLATARQISWKYKLT